MPYHRRQRNTPNLEHGPEWKAPNGQVLGYGDEFTVKGEGRFSFRYVWPPDGSIACYGPYKQDGTPKADAQARYFHPDRITQTHRKRRIR